MNMYLHAENRLVSRGFTFCVSISPMSLYILKWLSWLHLPCMDLLLWTQSFVPHLAGLQPSTIMDSTILTLLVCLILAGSHLWLLQLAGISQDLKCGTECPICSNQNPNHLLDSVRSLMLCPWETFRPTKCWKVCVMWSLPKHPDASPTSSLWLCLSQPRAVSHLPTLALCF